MRRVILLLLNTVAPVLVLAAALFGARTLVAGRERPPQVPPERTATLVEVVSAVEEERSVGISGQGTVVPARRVSLAPQVTGRVAALHEHLVVGGLVSEGDTLLRIERDDFSLAIAERQSARDQAEATLMIEQGRQEVATQEWGLYRDLFDVEPDDDALATRQPQVRAAEVAVEAAEARLQRAQLDYQRTTLRAPFDAVVQSESVELGGLVGPSTPVASLVDTTAFWLEVAVPYDALHRVAVPGVNAEVGSQATVRFEAFGGLVERAARVIRMRSELQGNGRMAVIVVEVEDPLELQRPVGDRRPLLLGAFVDVTLDGTRSIRGVRVPRVAIRNGDTAWVAGEDGALEIRTLEIVERGVDSVLVAGGVAAGEAIIVSRLGGVSEGMRVRTGDAADPADAAEVRP